MIEEQDTDEEPKDDDDSEILFFDSTEDIDFENLASDENLSPEIQEILDAFSKDSDIDKGIDDLLEEISINPEFDVKKEKSKLLKLLQAYLSKMKSVDQLKAKKNLKKRERAIEDHLITLSHYLIARKAQTQPNKKSLLQKLTEKFSSITDQAKRDLRNIVKRFAIYEVYQVMNPKRIAGETKIHNFVHNMIIGGFKRAHKYAGGKDKDLKHYNKAFIEKLEKRHRQLARIKEPLDIEKILAPISTPGKFHQRTKERGLGI